MRSVFWIFGLTILLSGVLIALAVSDEVIKDPVCGMEIQPADETSRIEGEGGTVYFCSEACMLKFCENPTAYLTQEKLDELKICAEGTCAGGECDGHKHVSGEQAVEETEDCTGDCESCTGH